jgi:hypothetical protein
MEHAKMNKLQPGERELIVWSGTVGGRDVGEEEKTSTNINKIEEGSDHVWKRGSDEKGEIERCFREIS